MGARAPALTGFSRARGPQCAVFAHWGGTPSISVAIADPGQTIAFRSAWSCDWLNPLGDPLALSQACASRAWASSQYLFQKATVITLSWPQVIQVKPFWSYLGTNTQWPPQLPGLALAPPCRVTSHTSWV